jgi:acyl transferase domain-containing protein/NADPH:quinone reductase-like Zn-dependent oxidoreductase/acyl carrier protein
MIKQEKIAIIGIGCRYAGNIVDPESFWHQLKNNKDAVIDVPEDRWSLDNFYDPNEDAPGKMYVRQGAFLQDDIYRFDYSFFGISARESATLDPQQKLLLEIAYEAFDDAGLDIHLLKKTRTGVFVGGFMLDNLLLRTTGDALKHMNTHTAVAGSATLLSNRISHAFDLMGPSVSIDTACSSSMVAIHLACQAIKNQEAELAIAGGVNVMINPAASIFMCKGKYLAKDGRSKAFFEQADGYGRGEGAGMVVLKSLDKAIAGKDIIYAVIEGTAVNQDGRTEGISLPNQQAQIKVIHDALNVSGIAASRIDYVEAHGTGTKAGDPIELGALGSVYGKNRIFPLAVGSVKINIGHTEAAAGVAGIIKTALVLKNEEILPHLDLGQLSSNIPFEELNIKIPLQGTTWYKPNRPAFAAVNSFGYGGTNGHAILSRFNPPPNSAMEKEPLQSYQFAVSARSVKALKGNAGNLLNMLEKEKNILLANLAYTLTKRKTRHDLTWLLEAGSNEELIAALKQKLKKEDYPRVTSSTDRRLVWVFTGMGPQWYDMGKELYAHNVVFRDTLNKCDAIFSVVAGYSLLAEMQKSEAISQVGKNHIAQASNFFIQVGLSAMLSSQGVPADLLVGHSVGEVAAAVVAKTLTLEEGVQIIYHRGHILKKIAGKGTLLAVGLNEQKAVEYLQSFPALEIATINSPQSVTVAGTEDNLNLLDNQLTMDGVFSKFVRVEVAYHSGQTDVLKEELLKAFDFVQPALPVMPLYSTVTATAVDSVVHDANYWWMNVRGRVLFSQTIESLIQQGYANFIEIGPHPVLGGAIKEIAAVKGAGVNTFFTLKRQTDEIASINMNLENLMGAGIKVLLNPGLKGQLLKLPAYAWDKELSWTQASEITRFRTGDDNGNPFLQEKKDGPDICWKTQINRPALSYLKDHQIGNTIVFPGAGYIESILSVLSVDSSGGTLIAESLEFITPLSYQEDEFPDLFTTLYPEGACSVSSRINESWTVHVKGTAWSSDKYEPLMPKDIKPLLTLTEVSSKADAYDYFTSIGMDYKVNFQTVSSYSFMNDKQVFSVLQNIADTTGRHSVVHPAMLDGGFQSLLLLLARTRPGKVYLPIKIDAIKVFKPLPAVVYCIAELTEQNAHTLSGNLQLLDQSGEILVDVQGLFCKKTAIAKEADPLQNWIYKYSFAAYQFIVNDGYAHVPVIATGDRSTYSNLFGASGLSIRFVPVHEIGAIKDTEFQLLFIASKTVGNGLAKTLADCHQLIALLQSPVKRNQLLRLFFILQNGLIDETIPVAERVNAGHTALSGFARVTAIEMPQIRIKTIDIQHHVAQNELQALLQSSFEEEELIYTPSGWRKGVLVKEDIGFPQRAGMPVKRIQNQPFRLDMLQKGKMDSLLFRNMEINAPGAGQVQIEVAVSSINFKDIMKAMGMLNEAALDNTLFGTDFGMEGAGIVTQSHSSVTDLKVGDRVYFSGNGLRTHINVNQNFVHKLPADVSFREAASFLVYLTAWIALVELGNLQKGERILIHAAAGGVGTSACNIALARGANIYATAGTNEKRAQLKAMGIVHVYDSRSLNFYEEVLRDTNGEGVDMVLNSLAGPALNKSLRLVRTLGRFIEIGKQDITTNSKLPLLPFNKSIQFIAFDLDKTALASPQVIRRFFQRFLQAYRDKQFTALPYELFTADQCKDAFKRLASGGYSGKAIVDFTNGEIETLPEIRKELCFNETESVLITGGCSGFGLRTGVWLAEQGVKHLILASRKGHITIEEKDIQRKIESHGCTVHLIQLDVTDEASVKNAIGYSLGKALILTGIIHAAAVLEDCILELITPAIFDKVFLPKALGGLYLHEHSKSLSLRFFVCYSSASGYIGNPGQLAYAAANCFLDGLVLDRISKNLPATGISWGAIAETGMVARNQQAQSLLANIGFKLIPPTIGLDILGNAINNFQNHIGIIDVNWDILTKSLPGTWTRTAALLDIQKNGMLPPFLNNLFTLEQDHWQNTILDGLRKLITEVTGTSEAALQPEMKLTDLGFDSIMSVELVVAIQYNLGINLSIMEILGARTIVQLASVLKAKASYLKAGL